MEKEMHESARRLFEAAKQTRPSIESAADLARALNQSEQTINNWSYRGNGVSKQGRLEAQKLLGISATWIEDGSGPMFARAEHKTESGGVQVTGQDSDLMKRLLPDDAGNVIVWERPEDLEPDENRVWIDRYDYRFSAGTGVIQWEIRQKKALPFDMGFFRALGVRPQDCKLAQVHGRSMEPYLFHRDMMMLWTTFPNVRDGHIYAILFEDEPLVKQIFKEPNGALRLHSYNAEFPDRILAGEQLEALHIAGEVIYRSGSGLAGGN
ncbi:helix-turn-helix transcriptional regulator [Paraburkholderia tropica]|uniref:S24 family peptidase n=1 Tax=Paraburkholderia tropica TaxID=92647 RepID=UPI001F2B2443|nr:LexA family transcriptional regulator [Paraburkholderia tropica]